MGLFSKKAELIVVEEYKIEPVESAGFKKLLVRFQDAKGKMHGPFEFHPSYAHAFSDDLVKNAARALAPKE